MSILLYVFAIIGFLVCALSAPWLVHFFYCTNCNTNLRRFMYSPTEERIEVHPVAFTPDRMPNLQWLIPMALSVASGNDRCKLLLVDEG